MCWATSRCRRRRRVSRRWRIESGRLRGYYPKKWINFPRWIQDRLDKMDAAKVPTCPVTGICMVSTRGNNKVPHLLPVRLTPYAMPELTSGRSSGSSSGRKRSFESSSKI